MDLLKKRRNQKRKKPIFLRQEWFRLKSLGKKWRRPRGKQSKLRKHIKGKGFIPRPGYGSPKAVKAMHPCGLKEILVHNLKELQNIDPKKECARFSSTLGIKKRIEILKFANENKIKVLNPQRIEKPVKKIKKKDDKKEEPKNKEEKKIEKKDEKKADKKGVTKSKKTKKE